MDPQATLVGIVMIGMLLITFAAMTYRNVPQALAMPLLACLFLALQGSAATTILGRGFAHFADIAVLFTAIAVPAHMIDRSGGFQRAAAFLGRRVGLAVLRNEAYAVPCIVMTVLALTYVLAALLHNVTAILLMVPVAIRLCGKYNMPSRWILAGMLVASNLGGFSTKWGDTPNIIESAQWQLTSGDFVIHVLPPNLVVLGALTVLVYALTRRAIAPGNNKGARTAVIAQAIGDFGREAADLSIDVRLLSVGIGTIAGFIVFQAIWPQHQIIVGALAIVAATLGERSDDRLTTLKSLDFDVYLVFASIFVLAGCVEHSWIGITLQAVIEEAGAAPWSIALTGYLGTIFTEAASWATAAAARVHPLDQSHTAAWALGAGICAGSSAIVTAASAGIILCQESARFKDPRHLVSFRSYAGFGLGFSILMLIFYTTYFTMSRG